MNKTSDISEISDLDQFDRNNTTIKQNGENREQRFNRRNRDENAPQRTPYNNTYNSGSGGGNNESGFNNRDRREGGDDRPPRRAGGSGGGVSFDRGAGGADRHERAGDRNGPRRNFDGRKREFDRQSGSDKTGVKAVDKREGGGAHNWGTHKQDIEDLNKSNSDWEADKDGGAGGVKDEKSSPSSAGDGTVSGSPLAAKDEAALAAAAEAQAAAAAAAEEEAKEITLDEWKAQRAVRTKPQFNIRKAGEGEDTSQWKQMIALQSRKKKVRALKKKPHGNLMAS